MPEDQARLWDAALDTLGSELAIKFLAALSWELTLAGRGEYGTEGAMPSGSQYALRCFNELLHRTNMQMCQAVGVPHGGYPDPDFLGTLRNEATRGDRLSRLESVIGRALRTVDADSVGS